MEGLELGLGWWPDPLPKQGQLEQWAQAARRTPLSSALHAHEVICIAGCHQKAIKFQAWDGVKYDLFCCLSALFILSQAFLRAQLGAAVLRMRNRSKLWLLSRASFKPSRHLDDRLDWASAEMLLGLLLNTVVW